MGELTKVYATSGNDLYIGEAYVGTATSSAKWRIKKVVGYATTVTAEYWADRDTRFNKIWDNRATSYSYGP